MKPGGSKYVFIWLISHLWLSSYLSAKGGVEDQQLEHCRLVVFLVINSIRCEKNITLAALTCTPGKWVEY